MHKYLRIIFALGTVVFFSGCIRQKNQIEKLLARSVDKYDALISSTNNLYLYERTMVADDFESIVSHPERVVSSAKWVQYHVVNKSNKPLIVSFEQLAPLTEDPSYCFRQIFFFEQRQMPSLSRAFLGGVLYSSLFVSAIVAFTAVIAFSGGPPEEVGGVAFVSILAGLYGAPVAFLYGFFSGYSPKTTAPSLDRLKSHFMRNIFFRDKKYFVCIEPYSSYSCFVPFISKPSGVCLREQGDITVLSCHDSYCL